MRRRLDCHILCNRVPWLPVSNKPVYLKSLITIVNILCLTKVVSWEGVIGYRIKFYDIYNEVETFSQIRNMHVSLRCVIISQLN